MNTLKLRKEVINSLANADEQVLLMVRTLLENYTVNKITSFDKLPEIIQRILLKSNEEARQGKVTSHKEIMHKYSKKFKVTK